jgi:hypothetical protein
VSVVAPHPGGPETVMNRLLSTCRSVVALAFDMNVRHHLRVTVVKRTPVRVDPDERPRHKIVSTEQRRVKELAAFVKR